MPQVQELTVHAPDMEHERFYVEKTGLEFQRWEKGIYAPDTIEAFIPDRGWISAQVEVWTIDDGSGNAPACNAHYFLKWVEGNGWMKCDLHGGLRIRMQTPTDEELIKRSGRCECLEWMGHELNQTASCGRQGEKYRDPAGQAHWFCWEHKPDWAKSE
jgi:hypothetical protein